MGIYGVLLKKLAGLGFYTTHENEKLDLISVNQTITYPKGKLQISWSIKIIKEFWLWRLMNKPSI